jgi:5-(carboxyamino)imidazole ribonucleotide mutase
LDLSEHSRATLATFEVPVQHHQLPAAAPGNALAGLVRESDLAGTAVHIVFESVGSDLVTGIGRLSRRPVLAVPLATPARSGLEALAAAANQPRGLAVASLALGKAGAVNAALFAVAVLALSDEALAERLRDHRKRQTEAVLAARLP